MAFANATAFGSIRSLSGLMTPTGRSSASKSCGLALSSVWSTGNSRSPVGEVPAADLVDFRRHDTCGGTGLVQGLARLHHLDLFEAVRYQDGDFQSIQSV